MAIQWSSWEYSRGTYQLRCSVIDTSVKESTLYSRLWVCQIGIHYGKTIFFLPKELLHIRISAFYPILEGYLLELSQLR
jgi:hypothetical protein